MNKKILKLLVLTSLIVSILSTSTSVFAANIYQGFSGGSYDTFVCNPIWFTSRYWVHKYSKTGSIINCNRLVSLAISHTKGQSTKKLTSSSEFAYSYSETATWNEKIGADFGIDDTIELSAEAGYGKTTGWGVSAKVCNSIDVSIPKNAKTGVYALAAGKPFYKMRVKNIIG